MGVGRETTGGDVNAPQMHFQPASAPQRACEQCGQAYTPKRAWSRFCSTAHRNAFHLAKAHAETDRRLTLVRAVLKHVGREDLDPKAVLAAVDKG